MTGGAGSGDGGNAFKGLRAGGVTSGGGGGAVSTGGKGGDLNSGALSVPSGGGGSTFKTLRAGGVARGAGGAGAISAGGGDLTAGELSVSALGVMATRGVALLSCGDRSITRSPQAPVRTNAAAAIPAAHRPTGDTGRMGIGCAGAEARGTTSRHSGHSGRCARRSFRSCGS